MVKRIQGQGGKAVAVQADVSKADDVKRLFAETKNAYGKVDVLVNNAGAYEFAPLESITAEHFHKLFNLNVLGLHPDHAGGRQTDRRRRRIDRQYQLHRGSDARRPGRRV